MKIHWFVPTWEPGVVGSHVLAARDALRRAGTEGDVYAGVIRGGMPYAARPIEEHAARARPGDVLCYSHAIGSTVADYVRARPEPLIVDYHNVTPHEFFDAWDRPVADALDWGRRQLRDLAACSTLGLAASRYSESELRAVGFARTAVVPLFIDFKRTVAEPERDDARSGDAGGTTWLFVGRIAPNKAQHELVEAFAMYRRTYDPAARLFLVGGGEASRYHQSLVRFAQHAGLATAITFAGPVSPGELAAYYDAADVFISVSRHEGFGVPLVEAMAHDLPVVARDSSAVGETVGGAALLLEEAATPLAVAVAAHRAVHEGGLRRALIDAGRMRCGDFSSERSATALLDALAPLRTRAA